MTTDNQKNFTELLAALTDALGCDPLVPEEEGRVLFAVDDDIGVALTPVDAAVGGKDGLMAVLALGPAPEDDAELLHDLLTGNYLGAETGGGTLAIDRGSGVLVLSRLFDLPQDGQSFVDAFAELVGAARRWRNRLAAAADGVPDRPDDAALSSPSGFMAV